MSSISLPNFVLGSEEIDGLPFAINNDFRELTGFSVTPLTLRKIKRHLHSQLEVFESIDIDCIFQTIEKLPEFYFSEEKLITDVAESSGRTVSELKESLKKRCQWCRNIRAYYSSVFLNFELSNHSQSASRTVRRQMLPLGPCSVILANNSDEEVLYVVLQCLLARAPVLLRGSSSGISTLSALELCRALSKAACSLGTADSLKIVSGVALINLRESEDKNEIAQQICLPSGIVIAFCSEETGANLTRIFVENGAKKVLIFGSGLASMVILSDANIDNAADAAISSISFGGGRDCMSTAIIYLHDSMTERFIKECQTRASLSDVTLSINSAYSSSSASEGTIQLLFISSESRAYEVASPVAFVRVFSELEKLERLQKKDLEESKVARSICCSVWTDNFITFDKLASKIKSYRIRWNELAHTFSPFYEHQGQFLIRELTYSKLIEG